MPKNISRFFTALSREEIESLVAEQQSAPHLRPLQKRLAEEITVMVHSREDYDMAGLVHRKSFGKSTSHALRSIDETTTFFRFSMGSQFNISRSPAY